MKHWTDNVEYITKGYWVYSPAGFDIIKYRSGWCVHTPNTYIQGFKTLEVAVKYCDTLCNYNR